MFRASIFKSIAPNFNGRKKRLRKVLVSRESFSMCEPVCKMFRLFGLCPVEFVPDDEGYEIKFSLLFLIHSYALAVFYAAAVCHRIKMIWNTSCRTYVSMEDIDLLNWIAVLVAAPYGAFHTPRRARFVGKLVNLWAKIDKVNPVTKYKEHRRYSVKLLLVAFLVLLLIFAIGLSINFKPMSLEMIFGTWNITILNCVLLGHSLLQGHLVLSIGVRLTALNDSLLGEAEKLSIVPETDSIVHYEYFRRQSAAGKVLKLLKAYKYVQELATIYNEGFSSERLVTISSLLIHLVLVPFMIRFETRVKQQSIALSLLVVFLHIYRLLLAIEPCYMCYRETLRIRTIIFGMLTSDIDQVTRKRVYMFECSCYLSSQLKVTPPSMAETHKTLLLDFTDTLATYEITFDALGFFVIDRHLFVSIGRVVTMYLVALFQLK